MIKKKKIMSHPDAGSSAAFVSIPFCKTNRSNFSTWLLQSSLANNTWLDINFPSTIYSLN